VTDKTKTIRRTARKPQGEPPQVKPLAPTPKAPSLLDQLAALLAREAGASIAEMVEATSWQQHSVRGAMAGALKKRGLIITSDKTDGVRRYRAEKPA
jgi:hypothetical protein